MTGIPASTADLMWGPSAAASGTGTTRPDGFLATGASMSWPILTMSNVSGALYSTLTPMSLPPWSTPFLKIDQKGSDAWPWVTTWMLIADRSALPGAALPAGAWLAGVAQAPTTMDRPAIATRMLRFFILV